MACMCMACMQVALQNHHTHFLLVDNPGDHSWGAEISLFDAILDRMSRERHVPLVTLVIRGQIGALQDVLDALDSSG